jgi:hypothetical protein
MPNQTTLILGAGASNPYGFPTGLELRKKILALSSQLELFELLARNGRQQIRNFLEQFRLSQLVSIDSFLAKNPEYTHLGKTAIAIVLLGCEREEILYSEENEDHWYRYLINEISPHDWEALNLSWLKIVTFNYDRSLYFYLHNTFKNIYKKTDEEVREKLKQLEFFHVYGSLTSTIGRYGKMNLVMTSDLDQQDLLYADFENAIGDIRVIPEGRNDEPHLKGIREILIGSHTIGIMGFGFDETNIQRIYQQGAFGSFESPKRVVATTKGMTEAEVRRAQMTLFGVARQKLDTTILFTDKNCSNLLRESLILSN